MNFSFFNRNRFTGKLLTFSLIAALAISYSGFATAQSLTTTDAEFSQFCCGPGTSDNGIGIQVTPNQDSNQLVLDVQTDNAGASGDWVLYEGNMNDGASSRIDSSNEVDRQANGNTVTFNHSFQSGQEYQILAENEGFVSSLMTIDGTPSGFSIESWSKSDGSYSYAMNRHPFDGITFNTILENQNVNESDTIPDFTQPTQNIIDAFIQSNIDIATYALAYGDLIEPTFSYNTDDGQIFREDLYSDTDFYDSEREQDYTEYTQELERSRGLTIGEVKVNAVNDLNSNATEQEAQQNATDTVDNFYSDIQKKIVAQWNREVLTYQQSYDTAQTLDLDFNEVYEQAGTVDTSSTKAVVTKENQTLFNGDTVTVYSVTLENGNKITLGDVKNETTALSSLTVKDPSGSGPNEALVTNAQYNNVLNDVVAQRGDARNNAVNITEAIFTNYEAGELDVTDVTSPYQTLQNLATDSDSTGQNDILALSYEQLGLAHNLTNSFEVTYTNSDMSNSTTEFGQLFVDSDSFTSLEKDTEYDVSNETAYLLADRENGTESVNLDGTFTIDSITNAETGESLNQTDVEEGTIYESDVSELEASLDEYRTRLNQITSESGLNGIGFNFGGLSTGLIFMLAAVLLGVALA